MAAPLTLAEAVFRLGQISREGCSCNDATLRRIAEIAADMIGMDVTGVAVYENGIRGSATACAVVGPWSDDESGKFLDQSRWELEDRILAMRLIDLEAERMHTREEMIGDAEFRASKLYNEFQRPLGLGDQALGLFRREDGAELLIGINALDHRGPLPRQAVDRANQIAPFVARCWAATWRREPAWMGELKTQSRSVLEHVLEGYDDDQIAQLTGLTYHSVRAHLKRLFREAGVRSRLHLMQVCRRGTSDITEQMTGEPEPAEIISVRSSVAAAHAKAG